MTRPPLSNNNVVAKGRVMRTGEVTLKILLVVVVVTFPPLGAASWRWAAAIVADVDPTGGWTNLIQTFGIAVTCLVALALAVWRILVWVGEKVIVPVSERHIKFLDEVSASVRAQSDFARAQREEMVAHTRMLEALEKRLFARMDQVELVVRAVHVHVGSPRPEEGKT